MKQNTNLKKQNMFYFGLGGIRNVEQYFPLGISFDKRQKLFSNEIRKNKRQFRSLVSVVKLNFNTVKLGYNEQLGNVHFCSL